MAMRKYVTKKKQFLHGGDYNPDQWLDRPDILAEDLEFMRLSKTNTFSLGIFAWSALEPREGEYDFGWLDDLFEKIHNNGGNIILATPSGAKPSWMAKKYPEIRRVTSKREQELQGRRHNHCFTAPVYREKTAQMNRKLAERYGQHPALLMWHVSNEYGGECHCDLCQTAFRGWLKEKYGNDLEKLNQAWWTSFWSHRYQEWDEIESPSPLGEHEMHGLVLDWRRFVTDQTIAFYENEASPLRELTPDVPITVNFMADTDELIPFQALDYSKFAEHVDVISWDAYPAWHKEGVTTADLAMRVGFVDDLYRSLKQQPFLLMESTPSGVNWHGVNKTKRPGMHLLSSMQMLAHGSDSILYFQWRKSRGSSEKLHGAVVDHDRDPNNRVFQDVTEVGNVLERLQPVAGSFREAEVAVLYDWDNHWALQEIQGFSKETLRYPQTAQEHYRYFWEQDIPVDVITEKQDFSNYKVLVAPMLYMLPIAMQERLKAFVAAGGTLVTTYITGIVDENDLTYLGGWPEIMQEICGVKLGETDTLYPSDSNRITYAGQTFEVKDYAALLKVTDGEVVATYQDDFYKDTPAVTRHSFGKGRTYVIGARTEQAFHEMLYREITEEAGIGAPFAIEHEKGVSVQVRTADEEAYVFVMNFTEEEQTIRLPFELEDILTQRKEDGQVRLEKYAVRVYVHKGI